MRHESVRPAKRASISPQSRSPFSSTLQIFRFTIRVYFYDHPKKRNFLQSTPATLLQRK